MPHRPAPPPLFLQQPLESAGSTGSSPREGSTASCLDQFAPMLPSDPIAQLPLLPTTARTSATERVAAWLLDHTQAGPAEAAAAAAADSRRNDLAGALAQHPTGPDAAVDDGCCGASSVACEGEEDAEELLASLAAEAVELVAQQAAAQAQAQQAALRAAASRGCWVPAERHCDADRRRNSLERFMKQPVQVRRGTGGVFRTRSAVVRVLWAVATQPTASMRCIARALLPSALPA